MALRLPDKWIWDFWLTQDGPDYHIFYLQADRSLGDPELRHWHPTIGHAVSQDLHNWRCLPDALAPSDDEEAWDSYTTWTGSVIAHAGTWYMFYTGTARAENGLVQRVGLATSPDLVNWTKHPDNPLIQADPSRYELLDLSLWHDQAWRDPWILADPETGDFHAFITARVNHGPADSRGVIAHARSTDLVHWDVLDPVTAPGEFGQMEVPQMVHIGKRWYLLFCTASLHHSAYRRNRSPISPVTGTHYLVADNPLGPFHYETDDFLVGDARGLLYSGKLIQAPTGGWVFLAFVRERADGTFGGEIIDPLPVTLTATGVLNVEKGLWPTM